MRERERERKTARKGEKVQPLFVDEFIDFNLNSVPIQSLRLVGGSSTGGLPRSQKDT